MMVSVSRWDSEWGEGGDNAPASVVAQWSSSGAVDDLLRDPLRMVLLSETKNEPNLELEDIVICCMPKRGMGR